MQLRQHFLRDVDFFFIKFLQGNGKPFVLLLVIFLFIAITHPFRTKRSVITLRCVTIHLGSDFRIKGVSQSGTRLCFGFDFKFIHRSVGIWFCLGGYLRIGSSYQKLA